MLYLYLVNKSILVGRFVQKDYISLFLSSRDILDHQSLESMLGQSAGRIDV